MDKEIVIHKLKQAGLRPTKQRMQLAALLWSRGCRHITAESLHRESAEADIKVSLATIYNTLHQFTEKNLLREVVIDSGRSYFDTNIEPHHHFLCESTGELSDIPYDHIRVENLPIAPGGAQICGVDVIVRIK